jgi:small subunit ribosomal protein S20
LANSRSARKRIRADLTKRERNRSVRSAVRTRVASARKALLSGGTIDVGEQLKAAIRELDRAGEKGILHRNNVSRRKSRLTSMAAKIERLASTGDAVAARVAAAGGEKGRTTKTATKAKAKAKPAPKKAAAKKEKASPAS